MAQDPVSPLLLAGAADVHEDAFVGPGVLLEFAGAADLAGGLQWVHVHVVKSGQHCPTLQVNDSTDSRAYKKPSINNYLIVVILIKWARRA